MTLMLTKISRARTTHYLSTTSVNEESSKGFSSMGFFLVWEVAKRGEWRAPRHQGGGEEGPGGGGGEWDNRGAGVADADVNPPLGKGVGP